MLVPATGAVVVAVVMTALLVLAVWVVMMLVVDLLQTSTLSFAENIKKTVLLTDHSWVLFYISDRPCRPSNHPLTQ